MPSQKPNSPSMHDRNDIERARHAPARDEAVENDIREADGRSIRRSRLEDCSQFALDNPRRIALFLDMDGTLLDLAETPENVIVPKGLVSLLGQLAEGLGGALAIVTGRKIEEIDQILAPLRLPASGVHGSELRVSSSAPVQQMSPDLAEDVVQSLRALAGRAPGAFAEPKGTGLAIHYRLAPQAEPEIAEALRCFHEQNAEMFDIWPGRKVFEVIPKGFSKGTAISALSALTPFKGRVPIMIGDDVGDEPAFAAAERLKGYALRVAGENFKTKHSEFANPGSVLTWLDALARRIERAK